MHIREVNQHGVKYISYIEKSTGYFSPRFSVLWEKIAIHSRANTRELVDRNFLPTTRIDEYHCERERELRLKRHSSL